MTPGRRRLVALATALAPGRAPALLARLGDPGGADVARVAAALAGAPRRARLAALAAALSATPEAAEPVGPATHPLLARLRREAAAERSSPAWPLPPSAGRTLVRAAVHPPPAPGQDPA